MPAWIIRNPIYAGLSLNRFGALWDKLCGCRWGHVRVRSAYTRSSVSTCCNHGRGGRNALPSWTRTDCCRACRRSRPGPPRLLRAAVLLVTVLSRAAVQGQALRLQQSQADAASQMIVLGVQQGIDALPPSSGQLFTYEFDPKVDAYVVTNRLGPTVFRSPQVIGERVVDVRLAASYFTINGSFTPIDYEVDVGSPDMPQPLYTRFGMNARAEVTVLGAAMSYGFSSWLEAHINLPIVFVDASADAVYLVRSRDADVPPSQVDIGVWPSRSELDAVICTGQGTTCRLEQRIDSYTALGLQSVSDGTTVGLGRINAGAKALVYEDERLQLAVEPELVFPSPNESQLSGSDSFALGGRFVGAVSITQLVRFYADVGYEYDVDVEELSRLPWDAGVSASTDVFAFDVGFGGSKYQKAIEWTPDVAPIPYPNDPTQVLYEWVRLPDENNELGTNFVNFLFGIKVRLAEGWLVSGAVTVPLDDSGFRPVALGTVALERAFQ